MTGARPASTGRVRVHGGDAERIAAALEAAGAAAVSIELPDGAAQEPGARVVTAWFGSPALAQRAARALPPLTDAAVRCDAVADTDWVARVQAATAPVEVAGRLRVRASWHRQAADGTPELVVDPGLAFGTGSHPTTRLLLEWLAREAPIAGAQVVDYGTGSGVLGLAALRLGARRVRAVDIDPTAVAVAGDNAAGNGLADRFEVHGADRLPAGEADVVLANILLRPLLALAPRLAALLAPGGVIALAGITAAQVGELLAAWQRRLELCTVTSLAGWSAVVMRRR